MIAVYGERSQLGVITLDGSELHGSTAALQEIADTTIRRTGSPQAAYKALAGRVNGYVSFIEIPDHDSQGVVLHAHDRHGDLGSVILNHGQIRASEPGLEDVVRSFVRKSGSPVAAFRAMTGWSNGHLWFVPADHDVKLASVRTYRRTEHGRTQVVRSYERTGEPRRWISPEKWAQGQLEWIRTGHAFEDREYHYSVTYDRDGPAGAQFLYQPTMGAPAAHMSEKALRGMLISYAPRPVDTREPEPAEVGRGSPAARALGARVPEAVHAGLDADQPSSGLQAATTVRVLADGTRAIVKSGEDEPGMDREELTAYVAQALGAGAPMVAREAERHGALIEEFEPGQLMARFVDPDKHLTAAEFIREAQPLYERGLWTVGLLDWLVSNYDRNMGNIIVREDGTPVPIDHGLAMFDPGALPEKLVLNPFVNEGRLRREMTPARFAEISAQLAKVHPEFARLHHQDWYDSMIEQLGKLKPAGYDQPLMGADVHKAAGTPDLDNAEKQALWYYTLDPAASGAINGMLRRGEDPGPFGRDLDSAIAKATPLGKAAVVYRAGVFPAGLKVGDTFTDKGFVSTSVSEEFAARNFTVPQAGAPGRLPLARIMLPPGTRLLSVPNQQHEAGQGEGILARGLTFKVTGHGRYQFSVPYAHAPVEVPVIELEVVPGG